MDLVQRYPPSVRIAALLAYVPRDPKYFHIKNAVKDGSLQELCHFAALLKDSLVEGKFQRFFGPDVVLVPAPRHVQGTPDEASPAWRICEAFRAVDLAHRTSRCLSRTETVTAAHEEYQGQRPSLSVHRSTIAAVRDEFPGKAVTIVDDVVTTGGTLYTCASMVLGAQEDNDVDVRVFALLRTRWHPAGKKLLVQVNSIGGNRIISKNIAPPPPVFDNPVPWEGMIRYEAQEVPPRVRLTDA